MIYHILGSTGLKVSRLCFGTLTIGPLQNNLPIAKGAGLLRSAYEQGVNFFDTAELYDTYQYIKKAFSKYDDVVITGRSYAYDEKTAQESLNKFLIETGRERAEIFLLHEQESEYTLKGHAKAIEYLLKKKEEGLICALGVSTHYVACVRATIKYPELDVVHPLINISGVGIADGTRDEMQNAIKDAFAAGKGIYSMKSLGGGNLLNIRDAAFSYIRELTCIHSIAVGMRSLEEVAYNVQYFSGENPERQILEGIKYAKRSIKIDETCILCGKCINRCPQKALYLNNGQIMVDQERCIFCGYCGTACSAFAIRIF